MITLITGGSGSGKSAFAESQVTACPAARRIYIATMFPYDEESFRRIDRHREMRAGKGFETVERYTDLKNLQLPPDCCVLLECMSNLVANEMFQENGAGSNTVQEVLEGIRRLEEKTVHLFIVTNEISSDGIVYDPETIRYQKYLGEINAGIGKMVSRVLEVVYGIPIEKELKES